MKQSIISKQNISWRTHSLRGNLIFASSLELIIIEFDFFQFFVFVLQVTDFCWQNCRILWMVFENHVELLQFDEKLQNNIAQTFQNLHKCDWNIISGVRYKACNIFFISMRRGARVNYQPHKIRVLFNAKAWYLWRLCAQTKICRSATRKTHFLTAAAGRDVSA